MNASTAPSDEQRPRLPTRSDIRGAHKAHGRRRRGNGSAVIADWADSDPITLVAMIAAVTGKGGAVTFGYTRDGGAYALGFMGDGDRYTDYIRPDENLNEVLAEITRNWAD